MESLNVGDLCKHFKGKDLIEKNIYEIIAINVKYTGELENEKLSNLVVYKNIFQKNKFFTREYEDLVAELCEEDKQQYNQKYRCQKLTQEEINKVRSDDFIKEKKLFMGN